MKEFYDYPASTSSYCLVLELLPGAGMKSRYQSSLPFLLHFIKDSRLISKIIPFPLL